MTSAKKLERVQNSAHIETSGMLRTTANAGLNVNITGKTVGARAAIRLRSLSQRLDHTYGQSGVLKKFRFVPLENNKCAPNTI